MVEINSSNLPPLHYNLTRTAIIGLGDVFLCALGKGPDFLSRFTLKAGLHSDISVSINISISIRFA